MDLTFIEAASGTPLVKKFTAEGTVPYPNIVNVNSHEFKLSNDITGLKQLYDLIQKNSLKGWALLRGPLTKELRNESRRGHSDRTATTRRVTLDFDNVVSGLSSLVLCDKSGVRQVAEQLLGKLPPEFANVSYVATASSSFGLQKNSISIHIELLLDSEVSPIELKRYLQFLNFENDWLKEQITLSSNALALCYPLDISVADNSKIIFIGTPIFEEGAANPFTKDADRVVFVKKAEPLFDASKIRDINAGTLRKTQNETIKALRRAQNIRAKEPRTVERIVASESYELLTNPDKDWNLQIVSDDGRYICANLNNGDSAGYWWPKEMPEYVFNFKGEPIFRMKEACPAFYDWYKTEFRESILTSHGLSTGDEPIVFREPNDDVYYSMIYNKGEDEIKRFAAIGLASIENFFLTWGVDKPTVFPEYDLKFNPTTNTQFNAEESWVNRFRPTKYLRAEDLPDGVSPTKYGNCGATIEKVAPSFFMSIKHVFGNSDSETEHFLNWLSCIMQKRAKTGTAWILTGTTGTGKGLLFSMVIRKIFGEYAKTATTNTIDDDKNGYLDDCLFLFVDEFKESDGKSRSKVHNTLKNMVTEKYMTIRHMHRTSKTVENFTNFMFSANYNDIMTITDDDRRFNVGTRQEVSLKEVYPRLPLELDDDEQLMKFCAVLNTHAVDESKVIELVDNFARNMVRTASMTDLNRFWHAVRTGELDHFVEHVMESTADQDFLERRFAAGRNIVAKWVRESAEETTTNVSVEDLRVVYNVMSGKRELIPSCHWSQALEKDGFKKHRARVGQSRLFCIKVKWQLFNFDREELLANDISITSIDDHRRKSIG